MTGLFFLILYHDFNTSLLNETICHLCQFLNVLIFKKNTPSDVRPSLTEETDCYRSCFCCWSGSDLAPLTSPTCCTQEITAKSSKADDCRFPGDHRQQIWCCFSQLNERKHEEIIKSCCWCILGFGVYWKQILIPSTYCMIIHTARLSFRFIPRSLCLRYVVNTLCLTWNLPIWEAWGKTTRCWIFHCYWIRLCHDNAMEKRP